MSLFSLPPPEQRLVEFLLLLPIAALIVCIYRNIIGLQSFGTFAPALVGLAFRDLHSLPGMLVFVSIVLVGWLMRRVLDSYRLLQVPRTAFLLSLVVILLIGVIVVANDQRTPVAATQYISLFPMVILTGMIERLLDSRNGRQHGLLLPHLGGDNADRGEHRALLEHARRRELYVPLSGSARLHHGLSIASGPLHRLSPLRASCAFATSFDNRPRET